MNVKERYELWCKKATEDPDLIAELNSIAGDEKAIEDRFYKDLEFGTGGLRGVLGAGDFRLNTYTIGKTTQGLANYCKQYGKTKNVAIAYDSRNKSDVFAKKAAEILVANGLNVYIYTELMPTPMLSFAVRALNCDAGIVVTASHNPAIYNGYKVYGSDGCQLNIDNSNIVIDFVKNIDIFKDVLTTNFDNAVKDGRIKYIEQSVLDDYFNCVLEQSINTELLKSTDLSVVYTPLHGAGNKPVREILKRAGINKVAVVKEQELPNGNFPTAPFPNPEIRQAFEYALKLAKTIKPDLLLATDPDCDRVGIAVLVDDEYVLLSGNEVGALLLDYCLKERTAKGTLPKKPIAVKTIVTSDINFAIAKKYNCEIVEVLTGFKFIGEQIGMLESKGEEDRYIIGFEESYGYLAGSYVRDKDAVVGSLLICEMAAFYKKQGKNLYTVMQELYKEHGLYLQKQISFNCEGKSGMEKMQNIMSNLYKNTPAKIGGFTTISTDNYKDSLSSVCATGATTVINLPKSDVLTFRLEGGNTAIVRPSGTEPKIKIYITAVAANNAEAEAIANAIEKDMSVYMA